VPLQDPQSTKDSSTIRQFALALELPFVLVAPAIVGGAIGFFLDRWLHTNPWLMIVLGFAGVVAGLRDVLKTASREDKKSG